jgi:hypothetical protein
MTRTPPPSGSSVAADLRYCGISWGGKDGVRMHYCDEPLGHGKDGLPHKCHCGATMPICLARVPL